MKRGLKRGLFAVSLAATAVLLAACSLSPTIKQISDKDLQSSEYQRGVEDGKAAGFNASLTACRAEYQDRLLSMYQGFKDNFLYLSLVKGGIVEPARVVMRLNNGSLNGDRSSFTAPSLSWEVQAPPKFTILAKEWFLKDAENYCYLYLKKYPSESVAAAALGSIEKPMDGTLVLADIVQVVGEGGNYALIAKVPQGQCRTVRDFYASKGYDPQGMVP